MKLVEAGGLRLVDILCCQEENFELQLLQCLVLNYVIWGSTAATSEHVTNITSDFKECLLKSEYNLGAAISQLETVRSRVALAKAHRSNTEFGLELTQVGEPPDTGAQ